jgi:AcrR family transcriptional regulator
LEQPRRVRRTDAERNRAAILLAFTELLASDGPDVPLYRVAQRAGVGQATLYRHFPERSLLAVAVFDQRLDRVAELAEQRSGDPRAFIDIMRELILEEARTPGLLRLLGTGTAGQRRVRRLTKRGRELLDKPLREAQAAGIVRPDLRMDDLHILFTMVEGAVQETNTAGRRRIGLRALDLLFRGVAEPGQWTAPPRRVDQVGRPGSD